MKPTTYTVDGHTVTLHQPALETNFPVGEDDRTLEDMRETRERVAHARTEAHFVRANVEESEFARLLPLVESGRDRYGNYVTAYLIKSYRGEIRPTTCYTYANESRGDVIARREHDEGVADGTAWDLTDEGREQLAEALRAEIARLEKRCRTYLKRYGTSKLRVWTYWTEA